MNSSPLATSPDVLGRRAVVGVADTVLVGRYRSPNGRFEGDEFLPVSARELLATQALIEDVVNTYHFAEGAKVLLASTMDQAAFYYPFEQAAMGHSIVVCSAEPTFFDAGRVESILRRFAPVALFGATKAMVDGLVAGGHDLDKLFAGRVVYAYESAQAALAKVDGIKLRRWREIGPLLALECIEGEGLHYDGREWQVTSTEGELVLTTVMPRALSFDAWPSGVRGERIAKPCACGLLQPRLALG